MWCGFPGELAAVSSYSSPLAVISGVKKTLKKISARFMVTIKSHSKMKRRRPGAEESAAAVSGGRNSGNLSRAEDVSGPNTSLESEDWDDDTSVEGEDWDDDLPQRLYATDRFPYGRLNVYSKPDILCFIRTHFEGKPEWKTIRESCFGKLFDIQVNMCPISCKLLHALLCRQLVTKQKYVLWMVYGGHPFRFSLSEFCEVTGLPGTDFVYDYKPVIGRQTRDEETAKDPAWREVVGGSEETTLADLANLLRDNPDMPSRRKLQIAFILIVDGVLIARDQIHKPTLAYVRLVTDLDAFLAFPWGRESFVNLMESLIPTPRTPGKLPNPEDRLRVKLQQPSYIVKGFALALQLVALKSISRLTQLLDAGDVRTFMTKEFVGTTHNTTLTLDRVLEVEHGPNLYVNPIIGSVEYEWDDEVRDKKVNHMLELIRAEHMFNKWAWPGGSVEFNKYEHKAKKVVADKPEHEKHVVARGLAKKKNAVLKPERTRETKRSFRQNKGKMFEEVLQPPPGDTAEKLQLQEWMRPRLTAVKCKLDSLWDHIGRLERQLSRHNVSRFHKTGVKLFKYGQSLRTRQRPLKAKSKVVDRPAMEEMSGDNNDDANGYEENTMGADRTVVNDNPIEEMNDFDHDHGDTANIIHELNNEDPLTTDNNRGEPSCVVEGNIDGEPVDRAGLDVILNVAASNLESNKDGDYVDGGTVPKDTNDKELGEVKEYAAILFSMCGYTQTEIRGLGLQIEAANGVPELQPEVAENKVAEDANTNSCGDGHSSVVKDSAEAVNDVTAHPVLRGFGTEAESERLLPELHKGSCVDKPAEQKRFSKRERRGVDRWSPSRNHQPKAKKLKKQKGKKKKFKKQKVEPSYEVCHGLAEPSYNVVSDKPSFISSDLQGNQGLFPAIS